MLLILMSTTWDLKFLYIHNNCFKYVYSLSPNYYLLLQMAYCVFSKHFRDSSFQLLLLLISNIVPRYNYLKKLLHLFF